jgi:hypothetical protein
MIYVDKYVTSNLLKKKTYFNQLSGSVLASALTAIASYPLEIVYTRMSSDMTRYGHKRLYASTIDSLLKIGHFDTKKKSSFGSFPLSNYYQGFSLNFGASVLYYSTLLQVFKFNENRNVKYNEIHGVTKKFISLIGPSFLATILASAVSYPIDTVKRQIQVNGALGYNKLYFSNIHAFKLNMDSGLFSFYK